MKATTGAITSAEYPNATEQNYLHIRNTPYDIEANNTDRYPLMNPYPIPEFPSTLILIPFIMATSIAAIVYKARRTRKNRS